MKAFGIGIGALFFLTGLGFCIKAIVVDPPSWKRLATLIFSLPCTVMGALVLLGLLGWMPAEWDKWFKSIADASNKKPAGGVGDELINFNKRAAMLDLQGGSQNSFGGEAVPLSESDHSVMAENSESADSAASGTRPQNKEPA